MIHDKRACLDKARRAMEAQALEGEAPSPGPPASPRRPPSLDRGEDNGSDDEVVIRPRGRTREGVCGGRPDPPGPG